MLTRRLPSGVVETVLQSESGQEGWRGEAHRAQETSLDDSNTVSNSEGHDY